MKKLFFIAALGVAGLMSASINNDAFASCKTIDSTLQFDIVSISPPQYEWVTVTTVCGKVFFLDANMYSCYEELQEDSRIFTDAQCGQGYSFDLPY